MKAEMEVISPGIFSTIQDLGRTGYLKYGVPISGGMDKYAAKIGNLLLQNNENDAVLEMTLIGAKLKFHESTRIAITGADLSPKINNISVSNNTVIDLRAGDELSFGKRISGCRAYLAVSGGFQTERIFGSRSWYEGITSSEKLEKGDKIAFESTEKGTLQTKAALKVATNYLEESEIPAFPGPEFHLLSEEEKEFLQDFRFSVSKNANRMAIQLEEEFNNNLEPIITGPVIPGTVQLTPSGRLIILMRDCQTTGGYPRVLQISEEGINKLAQKFTGDEIIFEVETL